MSSRFCLRAPDRLATTVYDELDVDDLEWDAPSASFSSPCPCGDQFRITLAELLEGEDIARCASCSLVLRVVADADALARFEAAAAEAAAGAG